MKTARCTDARLILEAVWDGAVVAADERQAAEAHLNGCTACQAWQRELQALLAMWEAREAIAAPLGFTEAVMLRVRQEVAQQPRGKRSAVAPIFGSVGALLLVLAALSGDAAGTGLSLWERLHNLAGAALSDPAALLALPWGWSDWWAGPLLLSTEALVLGALGLAALLVSGMLFLGAWPSTSASSAVTLEAP